MLYTLFMTKESKKLDPELKEDARTIYANLTEDIRFTKRQQWLVVYYCLILLGAILYLRKEFCIPKTYEINLMLSIISVLIGFLGCCAIFKFQNSLAEYRKKTILLIKNELLDHKFIDLNILTIIEKQEKTTYKYGEYTIPFCLTILLAVGFVIVIIFDLWSHLTIPNTMLVFSLVNENRG